MRIATVLVLSLVWARTASGQLTRDWQVQGLALWSSQSFIGGGFGYAVRPPGRLRFAGAASVGDLEGVLAGRAEGLLAFHVNPGQESGVSPYAAAGVGANLTRAAARGYLEVVLGLEQRPGRRTGWFLEAGAGGGLRLSAGYRFRSGSGIRK